MENFNYWIIGFIIAGLFGYVIWQVKSKQAFEGSFPYASQPEFLTKAEHAFFLLLVEATSELDCYVLCKVRVGNLLRTNKKLLSRGQSSSSYTNRIKAKYLDFIVCDSDMRPKLFIEYDDTTRKNGRLQKRDDFLKRAFCDAGLHYAKFSSKKTYTAGQIRNGMVKILGLATATPPTP